MEEGRGGKAEADKVGEDKAGADKMGVNKTGTDKAIAADGMAGSAKEAELPEDCRRYDDIINLPHHVSALHPAMPVADRAAQFMPFAALTGHGEAIRETGRLTADRPELESDFMEGLDGKLQYLKERIAGHPEISVTYFRPDARKAGGAYVTVTGRVRKLDLYERVLLMEDGTGIRVEEVMGMEGEIFSDLE